MGTVQDGTPDGPKLHSIIVDPRDPKHLYFGMSGGHMVPGSTIANLTALWAARDVRGVTEIVASDTAHVSIEKSARIHFLLELTHLLLVDENAKLPGR
jgi:L-2,4-diaminobutyrate decarboxylase